MGRFLIIMDRLPFYTKTLRFLMATSAVFLDDSDRNFASYYAPLSVKFPVSAMIRLLRLITSEIKTLRSQISNNELLITFQKGLRNLLACTIISGEQGRNPSLSIIRFVPSRTHILVSDEWVAQNSVTSGDSEFS